MTAITNQSWTDLGAGPLLVQGLSPTIFVAVSDTTPGVSTPVIEMNLNDPPQLFNSTSHIWARSLYSNGTVGVSSVSSPINKVSLDQTTPGTTNKVSIGSDGTVALGSALPAGTNVIGALVSQGTGPKVTITRPANVTAYTANDVVGGPFFIANIAKAAGELMITSTELLIAIAAIPTGMTSFTLQMYSVTPPSALADNAPWDLPAGDQAAYLGPVNLGSPVDVGSALYVKSDAVNTQITTAGTGAWAYLVTNGGFTPANNSEVYVVTPHAVAL